MRMEAQANYTLHRPFDRLRARLRFFFVIAAANLINVPLGALCFMFVWWFRDWCYWQCGVRAMRWYLVCAGIRVKIKGIEKIRLDRPAIYVSNHQSHFDIAAAMARLPVRFYFIAKKELLRIPIFGWALPPLGMIMIDRSSTEKAYASIRQASQRIREQNHSVLIYPEGGITKTGRIEPFKKGAFVLAADAHVPIVPIVVHGSGRLFSVTRKECRPGAMTLEILDPIDTTHHTQETREKLMEEVFSVMKLASQRGSGGLPSGDA